MPDLTIRPSTKLVKAVYAFCALLAAGIAVADYRMEAPLWVLYAFPIFGFAWAVIRHLSLRFSTLTFAGDQLRYQEGILTRSTRSLDIAKVQDIRVDQSLVNRLLGIGNLTLETAGESGRLSMPNIDNPHKVAERIHQFAKAHPDPTPRRINAE